LSGTQIVVEVGVLRVVHTYLVVLIDSVRDARGLGLIQLDADDCKQLWRVQSQEDHAVDGEHEPQNEFAPFVGDFVLVEYGSTGYHGVERQNEVEQKVALPLPKESGHHHYHQQLVHPETHRKRPQQGLGVFLGFVDSALEIDVQVF